MSVIVILILASLSIAVAFLAAFVWAVRSGQYEDTSTPSLRILTEPEGAKNPQGTKVNRTPTTRL